MKSFSLITEIIQLILMWGKQKDKLWYDKEVWHIKIILAYVTCIVMNKNVKDVKLEDFECNDQLY